MEKLREPGRNWKKQEDKKKKNQDKRERNRGKPGRSRKTGRNGKDLKGRKNREEP